MKTKRGFIQISLLIAIIASVLALGGAGYFGVRQYQDYQIQKVENEKKTQDLIFAQQKALEETKQQVSTLEQKVNNQTPKDNPIISATDLAPYLAGVVFITCWDVKNASLDHTGSGILWDDGTAYNILTNRHVVDYGDNCTFIASNAKKSTGDYLLSTIGTFNNETDISLVKIFRARSNAPNSPPVSSLNYSIGNLRQCNSRVAIGTPVTLIGYPAYGMKYSTDIGGDIVNQIVTNGIVSGYDTTTNVKGLPSPDYFVSAKIDSGNSGGVAFSKDKNGLCVLGIPTWLTVGNYETQGIVQNIHNVMYQP